MPEPEAHSPVEIQQTVAEARYAATSATGSASIQIINYNSCGPVPPEPPPPSGAVPPGDGDRPCPYRGLFHFGPNDAAVFFGRDAMVDTLQRALRRRPVLPLLGASGSGKSSLVFAGLVPRLAREGPGATASSGLGRTPSMPWPWRWCPSTRSTWMPPRK